MTSYNHPVLPVFLLTFGAFVLLVLITFSAPFISSFYFLQASVAGGVRFGMWGWCLNTDGTCLSPPQFGYDWDPQVIQPLTRALIVYPIAAVFTFIGVISLIPLICSRSVAIYQYGVFSVIALISFIASLVAFVFTMVLWGIAMHRFHQVGISATFGPLPWMSVAAMSALLIVTINSGCGTSVMCFQRRKRQRPLQPPYTF